MAQQQDSLVAEVEGGKDVPVECVPAGERPAEGDHLLEDGVVEEGRLQDHRIEEERVERGHHVRALHVRMAPVDVQLRPTQGDAVLAQAGRHAVQLPELGALVHAQLDVLLEQLGHLLHQVLVVPDDAALLEQNQVAEDEHKEVAGDVEILVQTVVGFHQLGVVVATG